VIIDSFNMRNVWSYEKTYPIWRWNNEDMFVTLWRYYVWYIATLLCLSHCDFCICLSHSHIGKKCCFHPITMFGNVCHNGTSQYVHHIETRGYVRHIATQGYVFHIVRTWICSSQCNVHLSSSHCEYRVMFITLWWPYMFIILWLSYMFITLRCYYVW
jgi:hypothetical protein